MHGVQVDQLPGEYSKPLCVEFVCDTSIKMECVSKNMDYTKSKRGFTLCLMQTAQISLRIRKKGKWLDTLFTGTYIIGKKSKLPVVCLNLKRENFDLPDGILTGGIKEAEFPDTGSVTYGRIWNKESIPVFVEYYDIGREPYYAMHRVKPFGGMTISMPERSLRLITDTTIGPKKIKISPFENKKFKSYKSIVLRTSGNDQAMTRIRDITLSSVARDLNLDYMDYRQAVLYVNGEYWGIYNLREKVNLDYLKYNHGASKDPKLTTIDITGIGLPEYQQMLDYIKRPFPQNSAIDSINKKLVFENYIDYIILQIHIVNIDSRGNVRFWKSKQLDNRWRWIFFDGDQSCFLHQVNFNYLAKRLSTTDVQWCNPDWVTVTLRNLLSHQQTKQFFINEYCFLLGTRLHKDTLVGRVDYFTNKIRSEIPAHVQRRNRISHQTVEGWESEIEKFKRFFVEREKYAMEHLKKTFSLTGELKPLKISSNIPGLKSLKLKYSSYLFDRAESKFFTDIPVIFEAENVNPKYKFLRWQHHLKDTSKICVVNVGEVGSLKAIYSRKPYSPLKNKVRFSFFAKQVSKKDSVYILGLFNSSEVPLRNLKFQLKSIGFNSAWEVKIDTLNPSGSIFFTNNVEKALVLTRGKVKVNKIDFPLDFTIDRKEWVLMDRDDQIIDSLLIVVKDSVYSSKKAQFFYRDLELGKWSIKQKFILQEKKQSDTIDINFKMILWIFIGLILTLIIYVLFFTVKKNRNKIGIFLFWFYLLQMLNAQTCPYDRFGLDSPTKKLVDNNGKGNKQFSGCRNVRTVLNDLVYRGGNNHSGSYMNPLDLNAIHQLKQVGFTHGIYLYDKNFNKDYPKERVDSLFGVGFLYQCSPLLDEEFLKSFMVEVKTSAESSKGELIYIHCWNGWHQSGRLSAMTLMQFCDFTPQMALSYWTKNTDGNFKGFKKVKESILKFRRFENINFTQEQKARYCPCEHERKLFVKDAMYDRKIKPKNFAKKR